MGIRDLITIVVKGEKMSTAPNAGVIAQPSIVQPTPQQVSDFYAIMHQIFNAGGGAVSPAPGIYAQQVAILNGIKTNVAAKQLAALADYQAFIGQNPSVLLSPTSVSLSTWSLFNQKVSAINAFGPIQDEITEYSTQLDAWYATFRGNVNPPAIPGVPTDLQKYV